MNENLMVIEHILTKYCSQKDLKLFADSIEELCKKGVAKGCYQDYQVLYDILAILMGCQYFIENNIEDKNNVKSKEN